MTAETGPFTGWPAADVATFGNRLAGARAAADLTREDWVQEDWVQQLDVRLTPVQNWKTAVSIRAATGCRC